MVGAFGMSSMGGGGAGLQWDVSMPPMGSNEDLATYDRVATLLGQMPSAMLFVSASPHALLIAQQAGWRTAYVPRLGATDHPRLMPNATRSVKKQAGAGEPAGPRSVGARHAEASLRKEAVFGSTHDSERRFSGDGSAAAAAAAAAASAQQEEFEATKAATTGSWLDGLDEEDWDGSLFDVHAPDMGTLANQLVPPHTSRWRP